MLRRLVAVSTLVVGVWAAPGSAAPVAALSGAIFTTDAYGAPVDLNIYATREDVYLNGGPGINASHGAAGLPVGTYAFQVTDPSGRTLLSTDAVTCRRFTVNGVIQGVVPSSGCEHAAGATVRLSPYAETPDNGGVYKVWASLVDLLDCTAPGNRHCFVPRYSKTDNFRVRDHRVVEINTRFFRDGQLVDGLMANWVDTNGATNVKWSEYDPAVRAFHEAHVEAAEPGRHTIVVADQPGCAVASASAAGRTYRPTNGLVTVPVRVNSRRAGNATYYVDVACAG